MADDSAARRLARWSETPFAMSSGGRRMAWADEEAQRVYGLLGPQWDVWYVLDDHDYANATWQAKPVGAMTAACQTATPNDLVSAAIAYAHRLPEHIATTRQLVRECESNPTSVEMSPERLHMLTARLDALLQMQEVYKNDAA